MNTYKESARLYEKSIFLSKHWISKFYPRNNFKFAGVALEKVQFFSQHHFFLSVLLNKGPDDFWSQYPAGTEGHKNQTLEFTKDIVRILKIIKDIFFIKPRKMKFGKYDVIILSSGRHLKDLLPSLLYLNKKYKVLVIGKIDRNEELILKKKQTEYLNFDNARQYLSRTRRIQIALFFLFQRFLISKKIKLFDDWFWRERLKYLKFDQFPIIAGLLETSANIFKKTSPKLLIASTTNDTFGASFCLTAKNQGIPVAEIQHGVLSWRIDYELILPDFFLVWGKIPANIYTGNAKEIIVGCPLYKKPKYRPAVSFKNKKNLKILVLLSPPYGYLASFAYLDNGMALKKIIEGLSKLANKRFTIILRSHPSYPLHKDLEGVAMPSNFLISNNGDVVTEISTSDIVITGPTTAGLIAILHKKPLLYFDNFWLTEKFSHPFVKSESTIKIPINSINKIDEYILNFINNKDCLRSQRRSQDLFIKNYFDNFGIESIRKIDNFVHSIIFK